MRAEEILRIHERVLKPVAVWMNLEPVPFGELLDMQLFPFVKVATMTRMIKYILMFQTACC